MKKFCDPVVCSAKICSLPAISCCSSSTAPAAWKRGSDRNGYQLMAVWPAAVTGAFGGYSSSRPAKPASAVEEVRQLVHLWL